MNCKPGDLAVFVASSKPEAIGRLVDVIARAPEGEFILPDGARTESGPASWVVRFLTPLRTTSACGFAVVCVYGSAQDRNLRPIRDPGEDARDETLQWLPVPSQHKEAA